MCLNPMPISSSSVPSLGFVLILPGSQTPIVSAPCLSILTGSSCCSGTCWDKSAGSTWTHSFGRIFGVSPAAPRTRVRETHFLPWPEGPTGWACLLPSLLVMEESLDRLCSCPVKKLCKAQVASLTWVEMPMTSVALRPGLGSWKLCSVHQLSLCLTSLSYLVVLRVVIISVRRDQHAFNSSHTGGTRMICVKEHYICMKNFLCWKFPF